MICYMMMICYGKNSELTRLGKTNKTIAMVDYAFIKTEQ
jgi:hypothetical protein